MNLPPMNQKDRRHFTRFPMNSPVEITIVENKTPKRKVSGICQNISGSGMLVTTKEKIPANTELDVKMLKGRIDLQSKARVIHSQKTDEEIIFGLALEES